MSSPVDPRVLQIETLALHAWPPRAAEPLDGWLLRRHESASRRVNSVWPNRDEGRLSLEEKIESVEAAYAGWGRPARYQVCPAAQPAGLDEALAERGYVVEAPTNVQVAAVSSLIGSPAGPDIRLAVFNRLAEKWAAAYCLAQEAPVDEAPLRMAVLGRIEPAAVFVSAEVDGAPPAVGRGVLEEDWLGIFGMVTHPAARRRGLAAAILGALAHWGQDHGARNLYLQVMQDNAAALRLYEKIGFKTLYAYHYRSLLK